MSGNLEVLVINANPMGNETFSEKAIDEFSSFLGSLLFSFIHFYRHADKTEIMLGTNTISIYKEKSTEGAEITTLTQFPLFTIISK